MSIDLLQKYYKGECTEEEAKLVRSWFASEQDKNLLLDHLQAKWQEFAFKEEKVNLPYHSNKMLERIHSRIEKEGGEHKREAAKVKSISFNPYYFLRIAALLVMALGLSFLLSKLEPSSEISTSGTVLLVKETQAGQKQTLKLPDGTVVTLNADSKLTYPETFEADKREVSLQGEAFFEVARDEQKPFTITTAELQTRVLGTSFNIQAYQEDESISIAVASGKVQVAHTQLPDQQAYDLLPGEALTFQKAEKLFQTSDFDETEMLSWKEGVLYFNDATFEEVKKKLERWYGVDLQLKQGSAEDWLYSGTFDNQSLENVLLGMSYVKNFSFQIEGKKVEIMFNQP